MKVEGISASGKLPGLTQASLGRISDIAVRFDVRTNPHSQQQQRPGRIDYVIGQVLVDIVVRDAKPMCFRYSTSKTVVRFREFRLPNSRPQKITSGIMPSSYFQPTLERGVLAYTSTAKPPRTA